MPRPREEEPLSCLLRATGLSCSLGGKAVLRDVSFCLERSEFVALLGINGAGKSTLLDILAGLRKTDSGVVELDGRPLSAHSPAQRGRRVCHLPQGVVAELPFTVEQIVLMGRYPHADQWLESEADLEAVRDALVRTQSSEFRYRRFSTLSGGERQRVLLAACLAQGAEVFLMDEPSTYLDLRHQLECFQLLRSEAKRGAACIAVTHDLNLALAHSSRIIVLDEGRVVHDMQAEEAWRYGGWLNLFSERLQVEQSTQGATWVAYR